jgi:hypothetical protein
LFAEATTANIIGDLYLMKSLKKLRWKVRQQSRPAKEKEENKK